MGQLVFNGIRTPDGTILESRSQHDYKTYIDKISQEEYMVDGGLIYLRRNCNKMPFEELALEEDAPIEVIREWFKWGTLRRDEEGRAFTKLILLKDLTDSHINNIIRDGYNVMGNVMVREKDYREQEGISVSGLY